MAENISTATIYWYWMEQLFYKCSIITRSDPEENQEERFKNLIDRDIHACKVGM